MMNSMIKSDWKGFDRYDFTLCGREAWVVLPHEPRKDGKWLLKTEYFGAFPAFQIEMLERGYALAHVKNVTRWCLPEDTDARAELCRFLHENMGLAKACLPVGMSCGGMQAIYFAAKYPELVSAVYLDAPVVNLLSCPCGVGREYPTDMYEEFRAATGRTVHDLINDRNQPVDHIDTLIRNKIPAALVCGDSDGIVPYDENGVEVSRRYRASDVPFFEVLKKGCDHHPHGLEDHSALIEFLEQF